MLHNVITHLPSASHLGEAQAQDDEAVAALLAEHPDALDKQKKPAPPAVREHGPLIQALNDITVHIQDTTNAVLATQGQKAMKYPAPATPVTAWNRIAARVRMESHDQRRELIDAAHERWRQRNQRREA